MRLARAHGVRVITEMSLAPGRYQLRSAGGPTKGAAGSVTYDLDIPELREGTARHERHRPDLVNGEGQASRSGPPVPSRSTPSCRPRSPPRASSRPDETVTLYAEVYENAQTSRRTRSTSRLSCGRPIGRVVSHVRLNSARSMPTRRHPRLRRADQASERRPGFLFTSGGSSCRAARRTRSRGRFRSAFASSPGCASHS